MRVATILQDSFIEGFGVNLVIATQGCNLGCPGCHNPGTHDPNKGIEVKEGSIFKYLTPITTGITVSGGEPTMQWEGVAALLKEAKARGLQTTMYTGLTKEKWEAFAHKDELLSYLDYVKIGPYKQDQRDTSIPFMGSKNQRMYKVVGKELEELCLESFSPERIRQVRRLS